MIVVHPKIHQPRITNHPKRNQSSRRVIPPLPHPHPHPHLRLKVKYHRHHCRLSRTPIPSNRILARPISSRRHLASSSPHPHPRLPLPHLCPLCRQYFHHTTLCFSSPRGPCLTCLTPMAPPSTCHRLLCPPPILPWGPPLWPRQSIRTKIFRHPRARSTTLRHPCPCLQSLTSKVCS